MDLLPVLLERRSIRKYTDEAIDEETLNKVLKAGLAAPSGKNTHPLDFVVVRERETLEKLTAARTGGAAMLAQAAAAIIVFSDEEKTDTWIEDGSIALAYMHLQSEALGLGSCWIQGHLRPAADGTTTEEYVQKLLGVPANKKLVAILSLGVPAEPKPAAHTEDELLTDRIHKEKW